MDRLISGAKRLGIGLGRDQIAQFQAYAIELASWNRRMNLTSLDTAAEIETGHFLDSLTAGLALKARMSDSAVVRLVDVGSGAGFPGIPLRIAFPDLDVTLIEATQKKILFLRHVTETLGIADVEVIAGRAEDLAHMPAYRQTYDVAVARALAAMAALAELLLPFCRIGGIVVAYKKGNITAELAEAGSAVATLGGRWGESIQVSLPELPDERVLVVVEKVSATPERYPRRAGTPQRRPVGLPTPRAR